MLREQVHDGRAAATTSSTPRPTPGSPGPTDTKKDLFSELPGQKQPPNSQILSVPQGTLVVEKEPE